MRVEDFDYTLPDDLIAKQPPKVRGQSKLLVLDRLNGSIEHRMYPDFIDYCHPGDVVVLNDTRVIKARLIAQNSEGHDRELLLLEKHSNDNDWHTHRALYRGSIREGEVLTVGSYSVLVTAVESNGVAILHGKKDLFEIAELVGAVPLPPYLKRAATQEDVRRYQTEFAREAGSVAAPTASLNFTRELIQRLEAKDVKIVYVTLHVGMGTFLPIRSKMLETHHMHEEYFQIPTSTIRAIQKAKQTNKKVIAIGTTVTRTLEYNANKILQYRQGLSGEANIFIYPGYKFKLVDKLLTNFHAPKSTVLMMAAAFAGWDSLEHAYQQAIIEHYVLLSYGDSMLII